MTGEYEDRNFVITRGDSRIAITLARNEHTAKLNRKDRFLVDDEGSGMMLAYTLSKPLKVGNTFGKDGIFKFVLQEVSSTVNDNYELGIADYYLHFPTESEEQNNVEGIHETNEGKQVWL